MLERRSLLWFRVEQGLRAQNEQLRAQYKTHAENEYTHWRAAGWLDAAEAATRAVVQHLDRGVPLLAAHRSNESVLFYLAGLTEVDPIEAGLNDGSLAGIIPKLPSWLWFAPFDEPPYLASHDSLEHFGSMARAWVRESHWTQDTPLRIKLYRNAHIEVSEYLPAHPPKSFEDLVLQHACATPRASRLGLYNDIVNVLEPFESKVFARSGGLPVFEDDIIAYLSCLEDIPNPKTIGTTLRAIRRSDATILHQSTGILGEEQLQLLSTYGPSIMPRSVAIGEARLEHLATQLMSPTLERAAP